MSDHATDGKNAAAVSLGKLRARTLTSAHQAAAAKALAESMSPEERSARAHKAAQAAIKARKQRKRTKHPPKDNSDS